MAVGRNKASVEAYMVDQLVSRKANQRPYFDKYKAEISDIVDKISFEGLVWASLQDNGKYQLSPKVNVSQAKSWSDSWQAIWAALTGKGRGSADEHWIPQTLSIVEGIWNSPLPSVRLIPAKRVIGSASEKFDDLSGKGLIGHLAKLQNPSYDR